MASPWQHRQVFEGLQAAGIGVQLHYSPVHLQPYYRQLGFCEGQFPVAETYPQIALSLPIFPGLRDSDQFEVVSQLRDHLLGMKLATPK
jgi:dTDP-4-amino-4,6-dideoxygalactose transaminase